MWLPGWMCTSAETPARLSSLPIAAACPLISENWSAASSSSSTRTPLAHAGCAEGVFNWTTAGFPENIPERSLVT